MWEAKDPIVIANAILKPISSCRNLKSATAAAELRAASGEPARTATALGTF